MIRTIASIFITLGIIAGLSFFDTWYVHKVFKEFHYAVISLQEKADAKNIALSDGEALQAYWRAKKENLHVWIPHTVLQELDYQLDETLGFLRVADYEGVVSKCDVLLGLSESIPSSYTYVLGNIF